MNLGSCKKYIHLEKESTIHFAVKENISNNRIVFVETEGRILGYNEGLPNPMKTHIYIVKKNIQTVND